MPNSSMDKSIKKSVPCSLSIELIIAHYSSTGARMRESTSLEIIEAILTQSAATGSLVSTQRHLPVVE
jgi:hypothetical protein